MTKREQFHLDHPDKSKGWCDMEFDKLEKKAHEDKIPGGLADNKEPKEFDEQKLDEGKKVESEHTSDPTIAQEISMDHLTEDKNYYDKLKTIEKSEFVNAAFIPIMGASSVDMDSHINATQHEAAKPMLAYLKRQLDHHTYGLTEKFETFEIPIVTDRGEFVFAGFCKEQGFFSGAVRRLFGSTEQEFENDTLEIIASVLTIRIGNLIPTPDDSAIIAMKEEIDDSPPKATAAEMIAEGPVTLEEEVRHRVNANGIDSLLNTPDHEIVDKLMNDDKPKVEIKVNKDNEVTITLFKSIKESEMKFTDELLKAFGKPEDNSGKKPAAKKPAPKAAKPDDENDDVLSEVQGDEDDQNPAINSDKTPQDDMNSADDEVNQLNNDAGPQGQNARPQPMGGDDENTLPGSNFGGNTGGRQAQMAQMQGQGQNLDPNQAAGGQPGMGQQPMDNHEYIKMTTHAAGKQFWYRDPMTGQIHEKPNAPMGHADFDNSAVLNDLISKVEVLSQQLDQLLGGNGSAMEGQDDQSMMDQDGMGDDGQMPGDDSMMGENADLEQQEEIVGQDLDGDGEQGEDPEHQQKVQNGNTPAAPQGGKKVPSPGNAQKPAAAKPAAPKAPAAKPKPDFDKMKKSLKEKYPTLSDEKLEEVLKKALPAADVAHGVTSVQSNMGPTEGDIGPVADSKGDSDQEANKKEKDKRKPEEKSQDGNVGGEPANKNGNAFEKIQKSKFERMWKVFNIEMPERLEKSEDFTQANDGLKKLQKCILKQGKSEADANKIVNRAVIEKYDLLGKGFKNFANRDEFIGNVNNNRTEESSLSFDEMQKSRKADSDARFSIKEYVSQDERLVIEKSQSTINEQISREMTPNSPDWSEYKEFKGEDLKKSQPDAFQKSRQVEQDSRWSMPVWKGSEGELRKMVVAKSTSINERIKQDELAKSQNVTFKGKFKEFDESIVKSQKDQKTDSEVMQEAIIKKNWKE